MQSELIKKIASDSVIDTAYDWLCERRKDYYHNNDIWDIRFRWTEIKHWVKWVRAGVKLQQQDLYQAMAHGNV